MNRNVRAALFSFAFTLALTGCASVPSMTCTPSSDLPAHKVMKKAPEQTTLFEDLYAFIVGERKDHAADIRDYNSLYEQCVSRAPK